MKFSALFTNNCSSTIDLFWKDYHGEEVLVRQELQPQANYSTITYFTHPFIARDSESRVLKRFCCESSEFRSVVFEGMNFGVPVNQESWFNLSIVE